MYIELGDSVTKTIFLLDFRVSSSAALTCASPERQE